MSAQPRATLSRRCVHAPLAIAFPAASRRFANSAITASSLRLLFCNQRRGERGQRVGPWGRPLCAGIGALRPQPRELAAPPDGYINAEPMPGARFAPLRCYVPAKCC